LGRTTREQRSELNRPETIEETAERVTQAGGRGIAVQVDHLEPAQVRELVARIDREQGRLDVLVNDIWGAEYLFKWNKPVWEQPLEQGLRLLRLAIDTHIITSHFALPLLIRRPGGLVVEVTDGTAEYNATNYRLSLFYDLAKTSVIRMGPGPGPGEVGPVFWTTPFFGFPADSTARHGGGVEGRTAAQAGIHGGGHRLHSLARSALKTARILSRDRVTRQEAGAWESCWRSAC
jgi:NAD(P)-dependent dehydrogenase (short-subunit alcohol dehydrogenase family)